MTRKIQVVEILEASTGGTRRHLCDLVDALDRERFSVTVICSTERDEAFLTDVTHWRATGTCVHIVRMQRRISPLTDLPALVAITRHLRTIRPDIVHTHSSKAGFLGRLAAGIARVPCVIHTPHVFPFLMQVDGLRRAAYFALERVAAPLTDHLIYVCEKEKYASERWGPAPHVPSTVIHNGISADAYSQPSDVAALRRELGIESEAINIGVVGRFSPQKGHRDLVLAVNRLATRRDLRLLMFGSGPLRRAIAELVHRRGLDSSCHFFEPRRDMDRVYALLDVCVLPSRWEGLPYALLEAMAAGRAVIATDVGGMGEVIEDGRTGLLIPPGDPHALADAITRLADDPELRLQLGRQAAEAVRQRFDRAEMVAAVERLYEGMLDVATGQR